MQEKKKSGLLTRSGLAWSVLVGKLPVSAEPAPDPVPHDNESAGLLLKANAEVQTLRLDLEEARRQHDGLRRDLEHEQSLRTEAVASKLAATLEPSMREAAPLLGQLALQARLLEAGNPVEARDVMALARAVARVFEKQELVASSTPGEAAAFDPALHTPQGSAPAPGAPITIQVPGYTFQGKVVRKALVETAQKQEGTP